MSDDQQGQQQNRQYQGGSVLDGLEHMGTDILDGAVKEFSGVGEVESVISGGQALGDLASAAYHGVTGDSAAASHDLGDAAADAFNAVPYHDAAWDGMMTLGREIDGPGNQDPMWDQGGEQGFRDAWGGTPQPADQGQDETPLPFDEQPPPEA